MLTRDTESPELALVASATLTLKVKRGIVLMLSENSIQGWHAISCENDKYSGSSFGPCKPSTKFK